MINSVDLKMLANSTGHRAEILDKVIRLIGLMNVIFDNSFLRNKLALKGGTALNLFYFNLPRLSVDIDLNYTGSTDRKTMLKERKEIETLFLGICSREGLKVRRSAAEHAGGKWRLGYAGPSGQNGNIEVDLSFMYRPALFPVQSKNSVSIGVYQAENIPVLDFHEIVAGKLSALLTRSASRDLFDINNIYLLNNMDWERLRLPFVVYGGMNRKDWRTVSNSDIKFHTSDVEDMLVPVMNKSDLDSISSLAEWGDGLVESCNKMLGNLLPFHENEKIFLDELLNNGKIVPSLLTTDSCLQDKISSHSGLAWKVLNVRKVYRK